MDSRAQPKRYFLPGLPAIAAALVLSATADASTLTTIPCEQVGRNLQSLEVAAGTLPVHTVDHVPIDPDIIDEASGVSEPVVPVLNLGPRVSSILRDIFDVTTEETQEDSSVPRSSSPVADSDQKDDEIEPADVSADETELPRFQRRMLRTDI